MQFITIQKRICLPSKYLDQNLMDHLLSKITELTYGNCTKEYGYILKIIKINDIISHEISRANTDNIFNVDFDVEILKPESEIVLSIVALSDERCSAASTPSGMPPFE